MKHTLKKIWEIFKFLWYLFQKPILITVFVVLCYQNSDYLIVAFKKSADWVAKQAGVAVNDHVIFIQSKKPKKVDLPKGVEPKPNEGFMWPVTGPVSSPFGPRWGNEFHHGIDVAVPKGTPVAAAKDGTVVRAGWHKIYGYFVELDHGNGFSTLYGHNSLLYAQKGQFIKQGDAVALSGSTGRSTGPHVHFEVRVKNKAIDPLKVAYDGIERQELAEQIAQATKKAAEEKENPDEVKRKYIVTLEKTKKLKLEALNTNLKEALVYWDATIAFQYRASFGGEIDTSRYVSSIGLMNGAVRNALLNVSELLPILATQIQLHKDPAAMTVKEVNFSVKT